MGLLTYRLAFPVRKRPFLAIPRSLAIITILGMAANTSRFGAVVRRHSTLQLRRIIWDSSGAQLVQATVLLSTTARIMLSARFRGETFPFRHRPIGALIAPPTSTSP